MLSGETRCLACDTAGRRPYLSLLLLVPILVGVPLERGLLVSAKGQSSLEIECQAWKNTSSLKKRCAIRGATERPQFAIPRKDRGKNRSLLSSHDSPACISSRSTICTQSSYTLLKRASNHEIRRNISEGVLVLSTLAELKNVQIMPTILHSPLFLKSPLIESRPLSANNDEALTNTRIRARAEGNSNEAVTFRDEAAWQQHMCTQQIATKELQHGRTSRSHQK